MAGDRDLTYRIGFDATDATSTLRGLERTVRSTMRSVEDELDDGATAGDRFAASIDRLSSSMTQDFASAAIAAEELQRALRDAGANIDVGDALVTLQRLGVSMDEVSADADKFAASLKQLDEVRATGVADLDSIAPGLASKLDGVTKSANSSKSALANMIGNSTQTMGQMVGVTGDLGVGIGQIGEYFADAAFEGEGLASVFKSFATVLGPMAALGVATAAVSSEFDRMNRDKAFRAEQVERFSAAVEEGTGVLGALRAELEQTGELTYELAQGFDAISESGLTGGDIAPFLASINVSLDEFSQLVNLSTEEWDRWRIALKEAGASTEDLSNLDIARTQILKNQAVATETAAIKTELLTDRTVEAAAASRIWAGVQKAFADAVDVAGAALDKAAEKRREAAEETIKVTDATRELRDVMSTFASMASRADALSTMFDLGNAPLDALEMVRDIDQEVRDFATWVGEEGIPNIFDPNDVNADDFLAKISSLRGPIQEQIASAFAAGGPEAARQVADNYVAQIVSALGGQLTEEQVRSLLGLDDLEATIDVALNASEVDKAKRQLDILTGLGGETPWTASIALALDEGTIDPVAAQAAIEAKLAAHGVEIPVGADTSAAVDDVDDLRTDAETKATLPVDASTAAAADVLLRFISRPRKADVYIDLPNVEIANAILARVADARKAPINAYLNDYPTSAEVLSAVTGGRGVIRVPVDTYLRNSVRLEGD